MKIKIKCKGSKTMPLDKLKVIQGEQKSLSLTNRDKLAKRILDKGFDAPFFVWKNNILDGTQRKIVLDHLIEEGHTIGPVPVCEIQASSLADAKDRLLGYVSQFGKLEIDGLTEFIEGLDLDLQTVDFPDFDMDAFLGVEEEITEGLTDDDAVPDPPKKAKTKTGDLYQLGDHRLLCGDSTKAEDVERLMGGEKADMVFTDPPYGVDYSGGIQYTKTGKKTGQREKLEGDQTTDIYLRSVPVMAKHCDGPIYVWFADTKALDVYAAIQSVGEIHALIIWKKGGGYGALGANDKQAHEPCLYWNPKGSTLRWVGNSTECTIWDLQKDGKNEFHPTQKPVALAEKAITNHEAASVADFFLGSGSTLIACEKTGRKCYGMELDTIYCDVIVKRWQDYTGKKAKLLK